MRQQDEQAGGRLEFGTGLRSRLVHAQTLARERTKGTAGHSAVPVLRVVEDPSFEPVQATEDDAFQVLLELTHKVDGRENLDLRHSRAIGLLAVALVVSGVLAARALPSGIYPPLQFPRIVVVAHSGTLPPQSMSLIVTRPIEQAIMAVPGVRRVRSRSIRGASEISGQFDPATDMVVSAVVPLKATLPSARCTSST